jgi:hypothetical protein
MEIVLPPYPVRSFTYCNEQVRAYTVSRVIVYNTKFCKYSSAPIFMCNTFQNLPQLRETMDNTKRYI